MTLEEISFEKSRIEVFGKNIQYENYVNYWILFLKKTTFFVQDTSILTIYLSLYERHLLIRIDIQQS